MALQATREARRIAPNNGQFSRRRQNVTMAFQRSMRQPVAARDDHEFPLHQRARPEVTVVLVALPAALRARDLLAHAELIWRVNSPKAHPAVPARCYAGRLSAAWLRWGIIDAVPIATFESPGFPVPPPLHGPAGSSSQDVLERECQPADVIPVG